MTSPVVDAALEGRSVRTAYLAAEDYEATLVDELSVAGVAVVERHGRLALTDRPPIDAAWSLNTWFDVESIPIRSIADAVTALRTRQRNWWDYSPEHRGRARLIAQRLPHVSARPLRLGEPAPRAPLGSWTLLSPGVVLAAPRCSSPFPNGVPRFFEDRTGPPSRAYLKLWEAMVRVDRWPRPGDQCVDLGASPGGWTWTMARLGATVVAVDKAPLAPAVGSLTNVTWCKKSAFTLDPTAFGRVDWLVCDVAAYPDRLIELLRRWSGHARNIICTVKLQGETDHRVAAALRALPNGRVFHLYNNKHELTFASVGDG